MKAPKINSSTDYGSFKKIASNRSIVASHLKNLVADIKERNLLHLFPIIVNSKMEIVEGQHRHLAAKELKVPLYYIIDDVVKKSDIAAINANRKSWSGKDYIHHYAEENVPGFKKLKSLLIEHSRVTITSAVRLMELKPNSYFAGGGVLRTMRAGKLDVSNYALALQILELSQKLFKKNGWSYSFHSHFVLGVKIVAMKADQDISVSLDRIFAKRHMLPKFIAYEDNLVPLLSEIVKMKT